MHPADTSISRNCSAGISYSVGSTAISRHGVTQIAHSLLAVLLLYVLTIACSAQTLEETWAPLRAELAKLDAETLLEGSGPRQNFRIKAGIVRDNLDSCLKAKNYPSVESFTGYLQQTQSSELSSLKPLLVPFLAAVRQAQLERERIAGPELERISNEFLTKLRAAAPLGDCEKLAQQLSEVWTIRGRDKFEPADPLNEKANALSQFIGVWTNFLRSGNESGGTVDFSRSFQSQVPIAGLTRAELLAELDQARKRSEAVQITLEVETNRRVTGFIERTRTTLDTATSPAELEPLIAEAQTFERELSQPPYSPQRTQVRQKMHAVGQLLARWRDRLTALIKGDGSSALQIASQLGASYSEFIGIYPRSRLMRTDDFSKIMPASRGTTGPIVITLPATLSKLLNVPNAKLEVGTGAESEYAKNLFNQLNDIYTKLLAGDPAPALRLYRSHPSLYDIESFRPLYDTVFLKILSQAFVQFLEVPTDIKPGESESIPRFLERVRAYAESERNLHLLANVLETQRWLLGESAWMAPWLIDETNALRLYMRGTELEGAGQFNFALIAYFYALTLPVRYLPSNEVGLRISRIFSQHPQLSAYPYVEQRKKWFMPFDAVEPWNSDYMIPFEIPGSVLRSSGSEALPNIRRQNTPSGDEKATKVPTPSPQTPATPSTSKR